MKIVQYVIVQLHACAFAVWTVYCECETLNDVVGSNQVKQLKFHAINCLDWCGTFQAALCNFA